MRFWSENAVTQRCHLSGNSCTEVEDGLKKSSSIHYCSVTNVINDRTNCGLNYSGVILEKYIKALKLDKCNAIKWVR